MDGADDAPEIDTRREQRERALANIIDVQRFFKDNRKRPPEDREVVLALRAIIMSAPGQEKTASKALRPIFDNSVRLQTLYARKQPNAFAAFKQALYAKSRAPRGEDRILIECLAEAALAILGLERGDVTRLLTVIRRPARSLDDCIDNAFDLASSFAVSLEPLIDASLDEAPFWAGGEGQRPKAAEVADQIMSALAADEKRLQQVFGKPFSAKREVLKAIVTSLPRGYLITDANQRMATLALAAAGVAPHTFVDRAFKFYGGEDGPVLRALRANLDLDGKIAFIRARANEVPALVIAADLDPFDDDPVIRRLRGDRVGETIAAIVDGQQSRVVLGVSSPEDAMRHLGQFESYHLEASDDEFVCAAAKFKGDFSERFMAYARRRDAKGEGLSALVMRLAIPVLEASRDRDTLVVPFTSFDAALANNDEQLMLRCLWASFFTASDKIGLGIIASSHDGVRAQTFERMIDALRFMGWSGPIGEALAKFQGDYESVRSWAEAQSSLVRGRTGEEPEFYFREPIRQLVLSAWRAEFPKESRDVVWCIGRAAAHQARDHFLVDGGDAARVSLARNMQALASLLSSIDVATLKTDPTDATASHELLEYEVLPPLEHQATTRPPPRLAYRYAWTQLLQLDIDGGREPNGANSDPSTRLASLLPFFLLEQPRRTNTPEKEPFSLKQTQDCPACLALSDEEHLRLLSTTAKTAFRAGRFDVVMACIQRGADLELRAPHVPRAKFVRLYRLRLALGLLHAGNPAARDPKLAPFANEIGAPDELTTDWVIRQGEEMRRQLDADDIDTLVARGKLSLRLGEASTQQGKLETAHTYFEYAREIEKSLANTKPLALDHMPISAGRGIRAYVRFLMLEGANSFASLAFDDGLNWPIEGPITKSETHVLIRSLLEFNKHRARRGLNSDRLCVRIDDARYALRRRDFENALLRLSEATRLAERNGAAMEVLIELAELRAAVALEHAMEFAHKSPQQKYKLLPEIALAPLRRLAEKVLLPPLGAYLAYHEGQLQLLETRRLTQKSPKRASRIKAAAEHFSQAELLMRENGLELLRPRLLVTQKALQSMRQ